MLCKIVRWTKESGTLRIMYIDHYAGSLRDGMEFRPYYLAREWVKEGHVVRVIGADYSHLRVNQPDVQYDFQMEEIDGIEYQWIRAGHYQNNGIKRALSMVRFVAKLFLKAKKIAHEFRPDVVVTSSTYPLDSFAGNRIAKNAKAVYIHEAHDVWPLTLVELGGMSRRHPFVCLLGYSERYAYRHAAKVISILPNTLEHMIEVGLDSEDKFTYIPNGVALQDWENMEELPEQHTILFETLKRENKFIVCYCGGHALSNALETLVDAADKLKYCENVEIVLVGKGSEKESLMKQVESKHLTHVHFLPPVKKTQVPNLLAQSDALYIGAASCSLYRYGISMNKVYDYMMAGKPILYGIEASNNEVEEAQCGLTIPAGNAKKLAEAIMEVAAMSANQRERMGQNGRKWVIKNCDYSQLSKRFLDTIASARNCAIMGRKYS